MMQQWINIFRVVVLIIGIIVLSFDVLLYNICEQQKTELSSMKDQQEVESEFNANKFKYQQDQIDRISKDLEDAQQQIRNQNDVLADQKEGSQTIQTSLVDIKAEADAIKQDIKGWQKDYVSVLAEFAKKMDDSQGEIRNLEANLASLNIPELKENINSLKADVEKITHSPDNDLPGTPPASEKKLEDTPQ
jgi:chromosome segregation ATPase